LLKKVNMTSQHARSAWSTDFKLFHNIEISVLMSAYRRLYVHLPSTVQLLVTTITRDDAGKANVTVRS